jgi:hypothetical protein
LLQSIIRFRERVCFALAFPVIPPLGRFQNERPPELFCRNDQIL